jgi:hypothetical protein
MQSKRRDIQTSNEPTFSHGVMEGTTYSRQYLVDFALSSGNDGAYIYAHKPESLMVIHLSGGLGCLVVLLVLFVPAILAAYDKARCQLNLRNFVGDTIFEFPISFSEHIWAERTDRVPYSGQPGVRGSLFCLVVKVRRGGGRRINPLVRPASWPIAGSIPLLRHESR